MVVVTVYGTKEYLESLQRVLECTPAKNRPQKRPLSNKRKIVRKVLTRFRRSRRLTPQVDQVRRTGVTKHREKKKKEKKTVTTKI